MEKTKQKCGRKKIYGEETVTFSIAVPKSKKEIVKTFVEALILVILIILIRGSLPRARIDQLTSES